MGLERMVQTATQTFLKERLGKDDVWDEYVPATQLYMNLKMSSSHQSTPYSLMFARAANGFEDHRSGKSNMLTEEELKERLAFTTDVVYPAINSKMRKKKTPYRNYTCPTRTPIF
jgi:hypothetical protein